MRYRLLGIDVDGTLLGPDHRVAPETGEAVRRARAAGLLVCLATGRSYIETIDVWRDLRLDGPFEPMVLIGGALVSEPDTGRTLYHKTMPPDLACEFADALCEAGYSAMAILDAWRHGLDYVLCQAGDLHPASRDWFSKMRVQVRRVRRLADAEGLPAPLRISTVVDRDQAASLEAQMRRRFDGRLNVHAIFAPNYNVTIVEAFAVDAGKWNALKYVAQGYRVPAARIAAIGDDVNDLAMIRQAALGVAMPDACPAVRAAAGAVAEGGLASFLDELVAGRFD